MRIKQYRRVSTVNSYASLWTDTGRSNPRGDRIAHEGACASAQGLLLSSSLQMCHMSFPWQCSEEDPYRFHIHLCASLLAPHKICLLFFWDPFLSALPALPISFTLSSSLSLSSIIKKTPLKLKVKFCSFRLFSYSSNCYSLFVHSIISSPGQKTSLPRLTSKVLRRKILHLEVKMLLLLLLLSWRWTYKL